MKIVALTLGSLLTGWQRVFPFRDGSQIISVSVIGRAQISGVRRVCLGIAALLAGCLVIFYFHNA